MPQPGPRVRTVYRIPRLWLADKGPTLAALLGLEVKDADGRVLREMLD